MLYSPIAERPSLALFTARCAALGLDPENFGVSGTTNLLGNEGLIYWRKLYTCSEESENLYEEPQEFIWEEYYNIEEDSYFGRVRLPIFASDYDYRMSLFWREGILNHRQFNAISLRLEEELFRECRKIEIEFSSDFMEMY